ncbi:hypothetical protein D3C77_607970 [compost metagenome]
MALSNLEVLDDRDADVPGLLGHCVPCFDNVALVVDDCQTRWSTICRGEAITRGHIGTDAAVLQGASLGDPDHAGTPSPTKLSEQLLMIAAMVWACRSRLP